MKKLFGKRKDKDTQGASNEDATAAVAAGRGGTSPATAAPAPLRGGPFDQPSQQPMPPLRLSQLQQEAGGSAPVSGRSGGGGGSGRPSAPVYSNSGYLRTQSLAPTTSGNYSRSLSRTQSGMSSGRRSARRPRELLDLSQPEQVYDDGCEDEAGLEFYDLEEQQRAMQQIQQQQALRQQQQEEQQQGWAAGEGPAGGSGAGAGASGSGSAGGGRPYARTLSHEQQAEQIEADMALAYQLAMQDQQQQLSTHDQQPPPALLQRPQQQQQQQQQDWGAPSAAHLAAAAPPPPQLQPPPQQQGPASMRPFGSGLSSMSQAYSTSGYSTTSEDVAVAAALAESQFAAQQAAAQAALARANDAEFQAAIDAAMQKSMVTINYDDLLRDIQLWIFDLEGATGDVNKALEEAGKDTAGIDRAMAEADPDDAEGMHRLLWLSEQYPLVQARLQELAGRVAPVNDTTRSLRELYDSIASDQPPLSEAEELRDAIISNLFKDLTQQGLDAHHPFAAYGNNGASEDQARKKGGGLRKLLSIGGSKKEKPAAARGGDLRDLLRQLIDDAKRIPPPPPMPVNYEPLLGELRQWVEQLEGVKVDVQAALEVAHHNREEAAAQLAAGDPADRPGWHRLSWLSEQHALVESRLLDVQDRAQPTRPAIKALQELAERVQISKPPLVEAEAARDAAVGVMLSAVALGAALPPAPSGTDVRGAVQKLIGEAQQTLPVPEYVDYSPLLEDIQQWIDDLEGAEKDVQAARRAAGESTASQQGLLAGTDKAVDPEAYHRLSWLCEQCPLVEARLQEVGAKLAPSLDTARALEAARDLILTNQPPLAEAEGMRDRAIGDLMVVLHKQGIDARPLTPHSDDAGGSTAAGRDVTFRQLAQQLIGEAQRLPEMPAWVDYRPLLADIQQWADELEGARGDVQAARQQAVEANASNAAQLSGVDQAADPESHYSLSWLSQQFPLVQARLEEAEGRVAPGTSTAIQALQDLCQQIEGSEPPLEEAVAARDAAVATLAAALMAQGLELPAAPAPTDVRGAVRNIIGEARNVPGMPQWVDYRPLLAELRQWIDELEGCQADLQAAQAEAGQSSAVSVKQLAAADEEADSEGWHRLSWLSQQQPLVEGRLQEVEGRVGPSAGAAIQSLQALCQHIESSKPPLEEAHAARDAAVAALVAGVALEGLPSAPAASDVRGAVQQLIGDATRLPEMPGFVDRRPLLTELQQWIAELEGCQVDLQAARADAGKSSADRAAQLAAADEEADPEGWHRLSWLSQQQPLVEGRLQEVESRVGPSASAAIQSLQELCQHIKSSKPPLEEAHAARDAAVTALVAGMALEGLPSAPAASDVRGAVQQLIGHATRLPDMPGFVDHRPLLAELRQWIAELEGCQADVQGAQQEAEQCTAQNAALLAEADQAADPESHYSLNWLRQQHALVYGRLQDVGDRVVSSAGTAIQSLEELCQHIKSSKPPLEEAHAARDAAVAALVAGAALEGLPEAPASSDVRGAVRQLLEDAKQLPVMPPMPVNYADLLADIQQWIDELEGCQADLQAAQQEAGQNSADSVAQLAAADEEADPEGWHRLSWLSQQRPLAEERLQGLSAKLEPMPGAAQALVALQRQIDEDEPPLSDATGQRDAAVASLMEVLGSEGVSFLSASGMRATVQQLIEEAQRVPETPGWVDHRPLLAELQQWIAALEGARGDVATALQAAEQRSADSAAQLTAADEEADPEGWHRLSWLRQQHALVDGRLQDVGDRVVSSAGTAIQSLEELCQHIKSSKPPLEEAHAARDAAVKALVAGMALEGLPSAPASSDVRSAVQEQIEQAERLPEMPDWVDYRPLLADIQQWVDELEGARGSVAEARQAAGHSSADAVKQLAAADEEADPEGWHRLSWLSQQLPLVEERLQEVATRTEPVGAAVSSLQALQAQVKGADKLPLAAAERTRNETIAALVAALAIRMLPPRPTAPEVRHAVDHLVQKAQHLPRMPPMPQSLYHAPPAPEGAHRTPLVAPRFNPPNISAPRHRKKSRGVKPAPEDAIKRDPRAITLFNELAQGKGVVVTTIDWAQMAKAHHPAGSSSAAGTAASSPSSSAAALTPRGGSATPPPSARRAGSASPALSAGGGSSAAATPRTPTPQPPSPSPETSGLDPEMSEEEAAAYLPTLPARAQAVAGFQPENLQQVSDFVADVRAQGGDAPRSGHAAVGFPARKWAVMVEAAAAFDQLLDGCDTLSKWTCPPQANPVAESHRLASYLDTLSKTVSRINYPHDPLRVRMAKAGLPWDDALLVDLRWAAQRAAAALMQHALDYAATVAKAKGAWQTSAMVQPLGCASIGAFKVHQFCGGFNLQCAALFDVLHERTVHYARMMDPKWFRSSRVAG